MVTIVTVSQEISIVSGEQSFIHFFTEMLDTVKHYVAPPLHVPPQVPVSTVN